LLCSASDRVRSAPGVAARRSAGPLAQAAERSRRELEGGPAARAVAARWLLMSPDTLAPALLHLNTLLREFALGGAPQHWPSEPPL